MNPIETYDRAYLEASITDQTEDSPRSLLSRTKIVLSSTLFWLGGLLGLFAAGGIFATLRMVKKRRASQ